MTREEIEMTIEVEEAGVVGTKKTLERANIAIIISRKILKMRRKKIVIIPLNLQTLRQLLMIILMMKTKKESKVAVEVLEVDEVEIRIVIKSIQEVEMIKEDAAVAAVNAVVEEVNEEDVVQEVVTQLETHIIKEMQQQKKRVEV